MTEFLTTPHRASSDAIDRPGRVRAARSASTETGVLTAARPVAIAIYLVSLLCLGIAQTGSMPSEMTHDAAHYLELARSVTRGEGFATYTHWALNLGREGIPFPDTYRAPLFPLLTAGLGLVFSDLNTAGKWVSVLGIAFVPVLVFLFARRRLGLSPPIALLGAGITLAHHHLVVAGTRALTEAPYAAAAIATLYFLTARRPAIVRAGLLAGIACLLRYQGAILLPVGLLAILHLRGGRSVVTKRAALYVLTLFLTVSPWLVRNHLVAGSPVYTDLKYHLISAHDPERSFFEFFHGLTPPAEPLPYMIERFDRTAGLFAYRFVQVVQTFGRENAGNPIFFGLAILGLAYLVRHRRRAVLIPSPTWNAAPLEPVLIGRTIGVLGIFVALNVVLVSLSFAKHRHLTSVDPIVALFAAAGVTAAAAARPARRRTLTAATLGLLVGGAVLVEGARGYRKLERTRVTDYAQAEMARPFLRTHLGAGEAVMAVSPYYYSYVVDRPAVSVPWCTDDALRDLAVRFRVRFVCLDMARVRGAAHPGSFIETGFLPSWMYEAERLDGGRLVILGIDLDRASALTAASG